MTRKAETEAAWDVHNEKPETFGCEKDKTWEKDKMTHSRYNVICKKKVEEYAATHPKPRQKTTQSKPTLDVCHKCQKKRSKVKMIAREEQEKNYETGKMETVSRIYCSRCFERIMERERFEAERDRIARDKKFEEDKARAKKLATEIVKEQAEEIKEESTRQPQAP